MSTGSPGDDEALDAMDAGITAAADRAAAREDPVEALALMSRIADRLSGHVNAIGQARGSMAVRLREAWQAAGLRMSYADLGKIMNLTRARAADIVTAAREREEGRKAPIALAVITGARGALVGKRVDGSPPWTFIGGEITDGETAEEAAVREVREETGAEVVAVEVIGRRNPHPATGRDTSYVACRLADPGAEVGVADWDELVEVRWVDLTDARLLLPGLFAPVDAYLARVLRP